MKPISTWLVRLSMAFLWVMALALWTGIFTILMLGIAENYNIKVVPEIAMDQYEVKHETTHATPSTVRGKSDPHKKGN